MNKIPKIKRHKIIGKLQFENLIADVFNYRDNVNSYFVHGRDGQTQHSIDIFSNETLTAIQCKYKREKSNTKKNREQIKNEIISEVNNFLLFDLHIKHFVFASTFDHDIDIQNFCITYKKEKKLPFALSYISWHEIEKLIVKNDGIIQKYFPYLLLTQKHIEFNKINIDSKNCSWIIDENNEFAFWDTPSKKCAFPIFDFLFSKNKTTNVMLYDIKLKIKSLYSGFTGHPGEVKIIKPHAKYNIYVNGKKQFYRPDNFEPIDISEIAFFRMQIQIFLKGIENYIEFRGRHLLYFSFYFNKNIVLNLPVIYLNTDNNKETIPVYYQS